MSAYQQIPILLLGILAVFSLRILIFHFVYNIIEVKCKSNGALGFIYLFLFFVIKFGTISIFFSYIIDVCLELASHAFKSVMQLDQHITSIWSKTSHSLKQVLYDWTLMGIIIKIISNRNNKELITKTQKP